MREAGDFDEDYNIIPLPLFDGLSHYIYYPVRIFLSQVL
jgi:hypothetical protein